MFTPHWPWPEGSAMSIETSNSLNESGVSHSVMAEQVSLSSSSWWALERLRMLLKTRLSMTFVMDGRDNFSRPTMLEVTTTTGSVSLKKIFFVNSHLLIVLVGANNLSKID